MHTRNTKRPVKEAKMPIAKAQKARFFRGIYRNFEVVKEDLSPFFNPLTSLHKPRGKERKNETDQEKRLGSDLHQIEDRRRPCPGTRCG